MKWFGMRAGREESRPALSRGAGSRAGQALAQGEWPSGYEAQVRAGYLGNAVAQRAVRLVAEAVGSAPLDASDPALLALVTARAGGGRLAEVVAAQVLLHGNAFVQVLRDETGDVAELYPLRPERVGVVLDASGWAAGYRYTVGGRVTGLRRGRFGTPIHGAQQGARLVLLDGDSVATIPIEAASGQRILVMANGVGDAVPVEASGVLSGRSLLPPAPVRLAARVLDQTLHCSWRRRSRTDWRWRDGIDTALAEEREAYRVTISTAGGTITLESEAPSVTVPLGATSPASGQVAVQQIGTHGRSAAATVSF
ncbi:phage portal protein [Sphingomonas sp. IC4-52]|uniref:phage portal protein n=1 Tax=Sphingomonas sp. IC4-52 TaxID=2887202 RepID=UPI001D12E8B9|nr:phage portal protein [Sphingomonas sp. IC4-52]MCC2981740.1 phage portal protein [Sphingomonas sp. IC4-52]